MRIIIFSQDERVYLPDTVAAVVEAMPEKVACIVLSPPMSTHGGTLKGLLRHVPVFGLKGMLIMSSRIMAGIIGRILKIKPRQKRYWAIEELRRRWKIPVFFVENANSSQMHDILNRHPADLLVSISYPQIIRPKILGRFSMGGINVHSAPLPRYRGLMPTFWVLYHVETDTAVTIHVLAEQLDSGDILLQKRLPIDPGDTWDSLTRKTKRVAGELLIEAVTKLSEGNIVGRPNLDRDSSYFGFPTAKDAREFRKRGKRMFA